MQLDTGLDVINDGEQGRSQYATYVKERLSGFEGERLVRARPRLDDLDFPEYAT
jgi:5-methyltetrahydropteroyltriglutamate--homocysteine methyltransferase